MDTYKTIIKETTSQFTEKHSRFIGYVAHTETDEEAVAFIEKIRSLHSDARHNCYAYVLRADGRMRYSDDGEPHGTAGKPMLDIINGFELKDVTVVVTRYFGGILLGTGGLVRAYQKATKDTLESAEKYMMVPGVVLKTQCDYSFYQQLTNFIEEFDGNIIDTSFEQEVKILFSVPKTKEEEFNFTLTDRFFSKISAEKLREEYTKQKIF